MNTRIARRILRVGQGPHEFMHRLLLAQTTEIHFTPLVSTADAVLFVVDAPQQAVQKAKEKEIPVIIRLDGVGIDAQRLSETERENNKIPNCRQHQRRKWNSISIRVLQECPLKNLWAIFMSNYGIQQRIHHKTYKSRNSATRSP